MNDILQIKELLLKVCEYASFSDILCLSFVNKQCYEVINLDVIKDRIEYDLGEPGQEIIKILKYPLKKGVIKKLYNQIKAKNRWCRNNIRIINVLPETSHYNIPNIYSCGQAGPVEVHPYKQCCFSTVRNGGLCERCYYDLKYGGNCREDTSKLKKIDFRACSSDIYVDKYNILYSITSLPPHKFIVIGMLTRNDYVRPLNSIEINVAKNMGYLVAD